MEKKMEELTEDELAQATGGSISDLLDKIKELNELETSTNCRCRFCGYSGEGITMGSNCPRCGQIIFY